ncbi:hypothetical protein [Actibacterium sp. 188UL27-1]|uniref:hypothetical protein n=1 Tax=Actibacterium sp. 188UL27-1 TaxID=2786961 RepID=UPI00195C35D6|nr:hypothetical protein [Actibacterium sp. 188UL27-1]MBM7068903.1 hypothetical protein [Actibacterium sp. 188UL27-1]
MVETADIKDADSFLQWLEETGQPQQVCVWLAHRGLLRSLPAYWRKFFDRNPYGTGTEYYTGTRSKEASREVFLRPLLRSFRALTALQVWCGGASNTVLSLLSNISDASVKQLDVDRLYSVAVSVCADAATDPVVALSASSTAIFDVTSESPEMLNPLWTIAIQTDAIKVLDQETPNGTPLWPPNRIPSEFERLWTSLLARQTESEHDHIVSPLDVAPHLPSKEASYGEDWSFWIDWYQRALDGTEDRWDMLRDIALLPDDIWEADFATLTQNIDLIQEKHELLAQTRMLKAELEQAKSQAASLVQRSHNHPPELVETEVGVARELVVVWSELEKVEKELQKDDPNPTVLAAIGRTLLAALQYCGKIADKVIVKTAEAVGSTAGKAIAYGLAAVVAAKQPAVQTFAKALIDYASKLPLP